MPLSEFEYLAPFPRYRGFSLFFVAKRPFFIVLKQTGAVFAGFVLEIYSHLIVEANGNKKRE